MIQQFPKKPKNAEPNASASLSQSPSAEQLEAIIAALEQGGLMDAPPSLAQGTMQKIARLQKENKPTPKTKQGWFVYRLKITAAMAASLILVFLPVPERMELSAAPQQKMTWSMHLSEGISEIGAQISDFSQSTVQQMMEVLHYDK